MYLNICKDDYFYHEMAQSSKNLLSISSDVR